jgi:predicted DNA-binding transcriptional regulator AlpA
MRLFSYIELGPKKGIPHSREHIRQLVKLKKFPAPVKTGKRSIAWLEDELDLYVATIAEERAR